MPDSAIKIEIPVNILRQFETVSVRSRTPGNPSKAPLMLKMCIDHSRGSLNVLIFTDFKMKFHDGNVELRNSRCCAQDCVPSSPKIKLPIVHSEIRVR